MFRKSVLALAIIGVATSVNVYALGLGTIDIKSSLNQPLKANIDLLSATDEELAELKVAVASNDAFRKAGLERPLLLNDLKFKVERRNDGRAVILVSSREPVQEAFLDFLLEVSWSKGKLVREYTVLVDPPVTMPGSPATGQAPIAGTSRAPAVSRQPLTSPASRIRSATASSAATAASSGYTSGSGQYGPVQRNETLWSIASRVRPDTSVSVEQMMLALLRANPHAFAGNNINNLKAGSVLRIPDTNEITSISRSQALAESRRQYQEWSEGTQQGDVVAESAVTDTVPASESRLQLVTPDPESMETLVTSGETGSTDTQNSEIISLRNDLALANEAAEAGLSQAKELESRMADLERQVNVMQRLIQLKDDELARLQNRLSAESAVESGSVAVEAWEPETLADLAPDEPSAEQQIAVVDPLFEESVAETGTAEADIEIPEAEPVPSIGDAEQVVVTETEALVEEPAPAPVQQEPGLVSRFLDNPLLSGLGALVVLMLGGLVWASARRRTSGESTFQETILRDQTIPGDIKAPGSPAPNSAVTETALISDLAVDEIGASDTSEADPFTEADVYLAYGRYQQAEDLVKEALKTNPDNMDLKFKLVEVFHAARDTTAFTDHANAIRVELESDQDPRWQKIMEMGRELDPGNRLYQVEQEQGDSDEPAAEADNSIDFDLDAGIADLSGTTVMDDATVADTARPDLQEEKQSEDLADSLEFNLDNLGEMDFSDEVADEMDESEGILEQADEVGTKLDLARAYMDMGDPEGARSILEEVMQEGSSDQKREAESMVEQLA